MLKYFLLFQIIFISFSVKAQYKLEPAFANLPDFSFPLELINAGDGTNRLFLVQQRGIIYVFNNSPQESQRKVFIDLSGKVSQTILDHGLLGLAFHPDYKNNHYFYVYFTFDSTSSIAPFWSRVSRFTVSSTNPDSALTGSEKIILTIPQPRPGHKGGKIAFGPDGYFYLSLGDGGIGGNPASNGQNKATLLGKILRLNVDSAANGKNYSIPFTNPFYQNNQGYKEEIYAYGVRNIWKFNFDYLTGHLWAGDVGENSYEEVDLIENGKNYGWSEFEGFHCYSNLNCDTTDTSYTKPIIEYSHDSGTTVTGGYIYRGSLLPDLYGKYIFADYTFGKIWALTYDGINPPSYVQLLDSNYGISTFGTDQNNELYLCSYSQTNGRILKLFNPNVITLNLKLLIEGLYNLSTKTLNVRDTVRIFLHPVSNPNLVADSSKILLDSVNFSGLCFFQNAPTENYYIRIKYKNGLETWSKPGGELLTKGSLINYDFTNSRSKAFGDNQIQVDTNRFAIYSADVNQDGIIDLSDLEIIDNAAYHFTYGYLQSDVNGDRFTDVTDLSFADNNAYHYVTRSIP
jgi:glucose/arabinose dehydrogenase